MFVILLIITDVDLTEVVFDKFFTVKLLLYSCFLCVNCVYSVLSSFFFFNGVFSYGRFICLVSSELEGPSPRHSMSDASRADVVSASGASSPTLRTSSLVSWTPEDNL